MFSYSLFSFSGLAFGVNYGLNRVRFPAPMPVGGRVRMGARLIAVDEIPGGAQITTELTFEREGGDKPVCVAESLSRVYTG
jgi:acyl dehydratase